MAVHREVRAPARHRNDIRSMDFVPDELADGRKPSSRSSMSSRVSASRSRLDQSLKTEHVVRVMERLKYDRGVPARISVDLVRDVIEKSHASADRKRRPRSAPRIESWCFSIR